MKRILIADRDIKITFLLKKILQDESYQVKTCNDCKHLLQLTGSQVFDLILVNSKMVDGSNPVLLLRKFQPGAAFIIILDPEVPKLLSMPQVFHQIRKPIGFRSTVDRIKEVFVNKTQAITSSISTTEYIRLLHRHKMTKALLVRQNNQPNCYNP